MKRSELYRAIKSEALAKMPNLAYVDLQKGQLENPNGYPLPLPALLIEFRDATYKNLARHSQIADTTIRMYLVVDLVTDSFNDAELESETVSMLDLQDELYNTMEGLALPKATALIRECDLGVEYGIRNMTFTTDFSTAVTVIDDRKSYTKTKIDNIAITTDK